MSRHGVTLEARVDELDRQLELMADEQIRREAELDRYRAALVRIADAESGVWGWIAHDALHPDAPRRRPA